MRTDDPVTTPFHNTGDVWKQAIHTLSAVGTPGWPWLEAAADYATDTWQRSVLYADVMRERGNQYRAHLAERVPHVLDFPLEVVMSGRKLPRPVNYGLVRIEPLPDVPVEPSKRPFVIVDPRAGHGPGIGGFKADSEVGVALRAGHPCYFIGFLPDPVPGQTVEDVMHAEAAFLEKVIELHPQAEGKPTVIGNCQAGWQILMTAAMRPELFGPIIVAGAPLSYWAGWRGKNPMRYVGGLLGGSWLTALTSDLGAGRFDGAWLVQNFEHLNPANTWWGKQYHLYANVDTEGPRYLGFEKYWGGYVYLNDVEIQYIVDNLFIGNRLSKAKLVTSDGVRLDLRNIRSPIVVFCSRGDNITPPPQALGWITDLYRDDEDILAHDQTIVYAVHDSIGHLGIFVSAKVGRREHRKFTANIDFIDLMPAGLYEAVIEDAPADTDAGAALSEQHFMSIQRRTLDDVRAIVEPDEASDRRFAAAARVSDSNLAMYRQFVQPWVRHWITPALAGWLQGMHPLRQSYEWWSDASPLAASVRDHAEQMRSERQPLSADNPLRQLERAYSDIFTRTLDGWRELRDAGYEAVFESVYGSPLVQALAGLPQPGQADPVPEHPCVGAEHRAFVASTMADLHDDMRRGGLLDAAVRGFLYVRRGTHEGDERRFNFAFSLYRARSPEGSIDMPRFRRLIRRQAELIALDAAEAIDALPALLGDVEPDAIRRAARTLDDICRAHGSLTSTEAAALDEIQRIFEAAARDGEARIEHTPAPSPVEAPGQPSSQEPQDGRDDGPTAVAPAASDVGTDKTDAAKAASARSARPAKKAAAGKAAAGTPAKRTARRTRKRG